MKKLDVTAREFLVEYPSGRRVYVTGAGLEKLGDHVTIVDVVPMKKETKRG